MNHCKRYLQLKELKKHQLIDKNKNPTKNKTHF
jgi:hypothetical protein